MEIRDVQGIRIAEHGRRLFDHEVLPPPDT
jgi:hypothetical protein